MFYYGLESIYALLGHKDTELSEMRRRKSKKNKLKTAFFFHTQHKE